MSFLIRGRTAFHHGCLLPCLFYVILCEGFRMTAARDDFGEIPTHRPNASAPYRRAFPSIP